MRRVACFPRSHHFAGNWQKSLKKQQICGNSYTFGHQICKNYCEIILPTTCIQLWEWLKQFFAGNCRVNKSWKWCESGQKPHNWSGGGKERVKFWQQICNCKIFCKTAIWNCCKILKVLIMFTYRSSVLFIIWIRWAARPTSPPFFLVFSSFVSTLCCPCRAHINRVY